MTEFSNYEATRKVVQTIKNEHVELVKNVCAALGHSDKADLMVKMFIYDHKFKKRKDLNAPSKPRSSYLHWTESVRPKLQVENPELDMPGMAKKMGGLWKLLTEEQKQPFIELAEKDKLRYVEEKEAYDTKVCSQTAFLQGTGSQNASAS